MRDSCPPGYSNPPRCEEIDECAPNPCKNNGVCADGINSFTCTCPSGFIGNVCETTVVKKIAAKPDPCKSKPCLNKGVCYSHLDQYTCVCKEPYVGRHCDQVSMCVSNPCRNGGTCLEFENNDYECICPDGFNGKRCGKSSLLKNELFVFDNEYFLF